MIAASIQKWAEKRPDKIALRLKKEEGYDEISYGRMWRRALAVAHRLKEKGVRKGYRIGLWAEGGPEWVLACLGIHLSGAVVVPLDVQYSEEDLKGLLEFSDCRVLVADPERLEKANNLTKNVSCLEKIWTIESGEKSDLTAEDSGEKQEREIELPAPDALMSIIFTSGTTGQPKGVMLSAGNIGSNVEGILEAIKVTHRDNILNILPLHHAYASTAGLFSPLAAGAEVTFCRSFKGEELAQVMRDTGVTVFPGVPQLFSLLERNISQRVRNLSWGKRMLFKSLLSVCHKVRKTTGILAGKFVFRKIQKQFGGKVRFFVSGGAKLDPEVSHRLMDYGLKILEGYGLSETAPVITFTPPSKPKPGSVGLPLKDVEIRIEEPNAQGQGEVCVKGPNVMQGYYKNEEATGEVIRDGWFHTGDLGYIDEDGMLSITGRAKDVIVLPSGKNIYPDEVEARYQGTPLVKEICILQTTNEDGSHRGLCAAVVPDTEALAARKISGVRERIQFELGRTASNLPSYMRITELVILKEPFPRTRLGKLKRHEIRKRVEEKKKGQRQEEEAPQLDEETRQLMENPQSRKFLDRLKEITRQSGPFLPSQDLEIDLGLDSLTRVEIASVLEQEFGVELTDEEMGEVRTVGDILERVTSGKGSKSAKEAENGWKKRLEAPAEQPLDQRFNLGRGFIRQSLVDAIRLILFLVCRVLFRARIEGKENLPDNGPMLLCPNHQSYIDPVILFALLPGSFVKKMLFLAAAEIFADPPLKWLKRPARIVPTASVDELGESLRVAAEGLRRGYSVCLFPEGSRSHHGRLMKPRLGAGILAAELDVPIVPVALEGAYKTLSPVHPGLRRCTVRLQIGESIPPVADEKKGEEHYRRLMQEWEEKVGRLQEKLREEMPSESVLQNNEKTT